MKNRKYKQIIVFIIILLLITLAAFAENTGNQTSTEETEKTFKLDAYLDNTIDMIIEKYNGEITREELYEGALKGIFDKLDDYSVYYTEDDLNNFMEKITGEYEGIGILMGLDDEYIVVLKVFENSPAEEAGLLPNDKLIKVNDILLIGKTTEEAASHIKGEANTDVKLTIRRNGTEEFDVTLTRKKVQISPVTYSVFNGIGYIKLDTFSSNADTYFKKALTYMDDSEITKIIFDLRNNPGGEVSQAVSIARELVPEGTITTLHFKEESIEDVVYKSYLKETKYELVLLVNQNSASATEILTGAIKDSGAGQIIGTQTFGKGKVQNIFPILNPEAYEKYSNQTGTEIISGNDLILNHMIYPDNEEIIGWGKLTTGEYYTRNGFYIDGYGIEPDIEIPNYELINNIDVWSINSFSKVNKYKKGDVNIEVYNIEKLLILLGYDVDSPDYVYDIKTFEAVKKFQGDVELYPYGVCDFTTQGALNKALVDKIIEIDSQFREAINTLN
jgi:carboxyl-terminal processing protease